MLNSPKEFYGNQKPRRGWNEVIWYTYVDPTDIKNLEYHVVDESPEEYEPVLKSFKGTT